MIKYLQETKLFGGIIRFNVFNPTKFCYITLKTASTLRLNKAPCLILSMLFIFSLQSFN
jgi:hypothetical protein